MGYAEDAQVQWGIEGCHETSTDQTHGAEPLGLDQHVQAHITGGPWKSYEGATNSHAWLKYQPGS